MGSLRLFVVVILAGIFNRVSSVAFLRNNRAEVSRDTGAGVKNDTHGSQQQVPALAIGYAPLDSPPQRAAPKCLDGSRAGMPTEEWQAMLKAAKKAGGVPPLIDAAKTASALFKALEARLAGVLRLYALGGTAHSMSLDKSRHPAACPLIDKAYMRDDVKSAESFLQSLQTVLGQAADIRFADADPCAKRSVLPKLMEAKKEVRANVEILASFLEKDAVAEAERSFFGHLHAFWGQNLLQQHATECPADWEATYPSEAERTGNFTWNAWGAVDKATRCWKWQTTIFPELAKQLRAFFARDEIKEYANWALYLCVPPQVGAQQCTGTPVAKHLAKSLRKVGFDAHFRHITTAH